MKKWIFAFLLILECGNVSASSDPEDFIPDSSPAPTGFYFKYWLKDDPNTPYYSGPYETEDYCHSVSGLTINKDEVQSVTDCHRHVRTVEAENEAKTESLDKTEIFDGYQGQIDLKPGTIFRSRGKRKVALCKQGVTAWSNEQSCNYPGPSLSITVTKEFGAILVYQGHLDRSSQWVEQGANWDLKIINDTDQDSSIYVHVE